ncbi:hypothetical protein DFH94DRAFT_684552 [Russula ochroleuca]|uniref:Uncharacterized protein n=1 Tax=Russula ochroleuca TaxID=152965 RepID=A0A9P5MJV2_9AGAM|nr:hypothetical protein DFH94DRAFT_687183 [Russula ochroleuca]KAF8472326.1 hypothetical protein DFH94DRAFT_684552 [Russula ochroleuca]
MKARKRQEAVPCTDCSVAESRRVIEREARCNPWEAKVGVRVRIRYNHGPSAGGVGAANVGRFEARRARRISAGVLQQWRGSEAGRFEARNASVKDGERPQAKTVRDREGGERVDGVVAMTMPSGLGSVAEETGYFACGERSTSGPFSSRMLRAAKVMEPEAGCDLCEAKIAEREAGCELVEANVGVREHKRRRRPNHGQATGGVGAMNVGSLSQGAPATPTLRCDPGTCESHHTGEEAREGGSKRTTTSWAVRLDRTPGRKACMSHHAGEEAREDETQWTTTSKHGILKTTGKAVGAAAGSDQRGRGDRTQQQQRTAAKHEVTAALEGRKRAPAVNAKTSLSISGLAERQERGRKIGEGEKGKWWPGGRGREGDNERADANAFHRRGLAVQSREDWEIQINKTSVSHINSDACALTSLPSARRFSPGMLSDSAGDDESDVRSGLFKRKGWWSARTTDGALTTAAKALKA